MESSLKLMELFITIVEQNKTIVSQNNQILQRLEKLALDKSEPIINKFDIDTQTKACKILNCSIPTLKKAIDNDILIADLHYRHNEDKSKYFFSSTALEQIKGKI